MITLPVTGSAAVLWHWRRWPWARRIGRWSGVLMLITGVEMGSALAIGTYRYRNTPSSRSLCEQLIPELEAYHAAQGQYPKTLGALDEFSSLPVPMETIENSNCSYYSADGRTFLLTIDRLWLDYEFYDSETKQWEYGD
ncbi:MAG: hypothetical protein AAFV72_05235 [Cyanobacteria bacterium J06635_1]